VLSEGIAVLSEAVSVLSEASINADVSGEWGVEYSAPDNLIRGTR
jgi:hypothetical protein